MAAKFCGIAFITSLLMRWKRFRQRKVKEDDVIELTSYSKTSVEEARDAVNIPLCLHKSESMTGSYSGVSGISNLMVGSEHSSSKHPSSEHFSLPDISEHPTFNPLNFGDMLRDADGEIMSGGSTRREYWDFICAIPKDCSYEGAKMDSVYMPAAETEIEGSTLSLPPTPRICIKQAVKEEHSFLDEDIEEEEQESTFERRFFGEDSFKCAGRIRPTTPALHHSLGGSYVSLERRYGCVGNVTPTSPTDHLLGGSFLDTIAPRAIEIPHKRRTTAAGKSNFCGRNIQRTPPTDLFFGGSFAPTHCSTPISEPKLRSPVRRDPRVHLKKALGF